MLMDFEIKKLKHYLNIDPPSDINAPTAVIDQRKVDNIKHKIRTGQLAILNPEAPDFDDVCFNLSKKIIQFEEEKCGVSAQIQTASNKTAEFTEKAPTHMETEIK